MKSVPTGGKQIHQDKYKHFIHFSQSFINGNDVPNSKKKDHIFKMYSQYTELSYLPDYIHMTLLK